MSAFLPEQSQNAPSGVTEFSPASPQTTTDDVALMQRVFSAAAQNPLMLPADFMAYLLDYVQTQRLIIPIGQVIGFSQFVASFANVATRESTSSGSYTDLATVGPELDGLSGGSYVFLYGCGAFVGTGVGGQIYVSLSLNGAAPSDANASRLDVNSSTIGNISPMARATIATLSEGSNQAKVQYKEVTGNTAQFENRWLLALKYANL